MVARLMLSLDQHQHPILTTVFFVLLILVSSSCGGDSDDKDYTDCNKPFDCGLLQQLSYPFWGGDRPEVCGHEGFELKCADGQHPILASDALEYRLSSLNQSSRLMTLRLERSQQYICPAQIQANSSSGRRDSHIFGYDLSLQSLNLLYNCTTSTSEVLSKSRISFCNGYNGSSFYGNDDIFGLLDVDQCSMRIRIPIAKSFDQLVGDRQDLEEVLGDGFNVSYEYDQGPSICEGCMASKGICGTNITHPDKQFMCLCPDQPYALVCQGTSLNVGRKVAIGLGASFGTVVIMLVAFFFWYRRKKRQYESIFSRSMKSVPSSKAHMERRSSYNGVHLFSYEELEEATNNFDKTRELGDGGCGTVYYGKLLDGREVAVKRLYDNNYKMLEQFLNEVDILTRLRHQNLVLLHRHEINLSTMAINKIQNNSLNELVDPSLGFESDYAARKMISAVAGLSFQCLQRAKELRPSMEKVVEILKEIQSRDYNEERAEDKDSSSDGVGLLKSCPIPPSPDTVTVTWNSTSSTPYASV
ncbi:LEAF RUST 10 DISEASE-RESISTANCE LOCUS RECEPTOR-LIKE PROTEIN KINASE-LIKE 1.2 [Salix viminalis]|uniref:non-specific serine/threonine protein kinase n=1 Tax=Salix viminalis TaxID=40686 RepID=A0A9Q0SGJ4_SALVM|nr:LEAF RUST 10 DISEASE-RESISTANCE LOCUS RECEPTOR-LIKE PROTEIN KINASE-LIKE 1.2 [Salix viminalis]